MELIITALASSLEKDVHPEDDIKLMESLLKFQEQVKYSAENNFARNVQDKWNCDI